MDKRTWKPKNQVWEDTKAGINPRKTPTNNRGKKRHTEKHTDRCGHGEKQNIGIHKNILIINSHFKG